MRLNTPPVCYYRAGSSIVALELDADVADAVMGEPRDVGYPTLVSVTDPATGNTKVCFSDEPISLLTSVFFDSRLSTAGSRWGGFSLSSFGCC